MICHVYFSLGHLQIRLPKHVAPWCRKNLYQASLCLQSQCSSASWSPNCSQGMELSHAQNRTCLKKALFALGVVTGVKWAEERLPLVLKERALPEGHFPWSVELISQSCYKIFSCMQRLLIWQLWGKSCSFGHKERQSRVFSVDFPYWLDVWNLYLCLGAFLLVWVWVNKCNYKSIKAHRGFVLIFLLLFKSKKCRSVSFFQLHRWVWSPDMFQ